MALRASVYDPGDPMGKMFFNILATFAEFEGDLIRMRTREGMAIARAKGKLRGKQPKLSEKRQKELRGCTRPATTRSATWPSCSTCRGRRFTGRSRANRREPPERLDRSADAQVDVEQTFRLTFRPLEA